jgi:DNA-binding transcriptional regulator YiaG
MAFYVTHAFEQEQFSATLRRVKRFRKTHFMVYVPHRQMELAFNVGQAMGRELGGTAEIASSVREAKQLLKSWDAVITNPPYGLQSQDLLEARTRLGLTQEEMASALNITARTLQNWERNIGTSQMRRKTRDLWELLELMDDYVVAREEKNWLKTPRPAFRNKTPVDLIIEGKIRDLVVEFQRLREGQPI